MEKPTFGATLIRRDGKSRLDKPGLSGVDYVLWRIAEWLGT
jgi:hypothetical protein